MERYRYDVIAEMPLGTRQGALTLDIQDGRCSGVLELLRFCNMVSGRITGDGQCTLAGELKTLLHSRPFTAEGSCGAERAELTLQCGRVRCLLHGKRTEERHD